VAVGACGGLGVEGAVGVVELWVALAVVVV